MLKRYKLKNYFRKLPKGKSISLLTMFIKFQLLKIRLLSIILLFVFVIRSNKINLQSNFITLKKKALRSTVYKMLYIFLFFIETIFYCERKMKVFDSWHCLNMSPVCLFFFLGGAKKVFKKKIFILRNQILFVDNNIKLFLIKI